MIDLAARATYFLFAHQDDEMGVFEVLRRAKVAGDPVVIIYLTNGDWGGIDPDKRARESCHVLTAFGVERDCIVQLGIDCNISDGQLADRLETAWRALEMLVRRLGSPSRVITHAFEGGHQDHDAAYVLGTRLAIDHGVIGQSRQFTLYRAADGGVVPFRLFSPLAENGPVEELRIPPVDRLRYLGLCLNYRTQTRTMIGLLPFMALHFARRGTQLLQPIVADRPKGRPHSGVLLYERRKRATWAQIERCINAFLSTGD